MKGTILLVDDETEIADLAKEILVKGGYRVKHVRDADAAIAFFKSDSADVALLDIEMPGISGIKLLKLLREDEKTADMPIIMITVLGDEANRIRGLQAGADDYLGKPFSPKELLARVEALLRRAHRAAQGSRVLQAGPIAIDVDRQEVSVAGERVKLTQAEFSLLSVLASRKGFVLTYQALSDVLSSGGRIMTSENLYAHVKNLRRQLGKAGDMIETVHGVGYKLVTP